MEKNEAFDLSAAISRIKHHLPTQAPLKDFIHHNTLHAFQGETFHKALKQVAQQYGYRVYAALEEYRKWYNDGSIAPEVLQRIVQEHSTYADSPQWMDHLLHKNYPDFSPAQVGVLRSQWRPLSHINMDKETHAILFRLLGAYLDQGVARWEMPEHSKGFLAAVRHLELEQNGAVMRSVSAREKLLNQNLSTEELLFDIVGREDWFEHYLEDQQMSHPGWSGMVAFLESNRSALMEPRVITLQEVIHLELLLEWDVLQQKGAVKNGPLSHQLPNDFQSRPKSENKDEEELFNVLAIWQEALEYSLYDQVLNALNQEKNKTDLAVQYQAVFCIDDREESIRRHLECVNPQVETFGTAGFFSVPIYFQAAGARHLTKVCPAPITPKHAIKELNAVLRHDQDPHISSLHHGGIKGWVSSQLTGFSAAFQLAKSVLKPGPTPVKVSSFQHMDSQGKLALDHDPLNDDQGLKWGFELPEMVQAVQSFVKTMGMGTSGFAPLVYIMGHGASSVNNTHYAGYDCGACSGRSGSVNARLLAMMANRMDVRKELLSMGICIPESTRFIGALHDTTRDEVEYFDWQELSSEWLDLHADFVRSMDKALQNNAAERSRRFASVDHSTDFNKRHLQVKTRSLSLFEPRPEWNHATNALCIVGPRSSHRHVFLDRRAFLQSYDWKQDPDGVYLLPILNAIAPVCGGINLEYYFSKVDNDKLGAGTKLPHNVMGLIGVANGMDGDLRTGLPKQMVNIHKPLRLMALVEQSPEVVRRVLDQAPATAEWFRNEWVWLVVKDPQSGHYFRMKEGRFVPYEPIQLVVPAMRSWEQLLESDSDLPISLCELAGEVAP